MPMRVSPPTSHGLVPMRNSPYIYGRCCYIMSTQPHLLRCSSPRRKSSASSLHTSVSSSAVPSGVSAVSHDHPTTRRQSDSSARITSPELCHCYSTQALPIICWLRLVVSCLLLLLLLLPMTTAQLPLTSTLQASVTDPSLLAGLEQSLLTVFGLSKRPTPSSKKSARFAVHPHMQRLYEDHVRSGVRNSDVLQRRHPTYAANTIRSFMQHHDADGVHEDGVVLQFNISSLANEEQLKAAELRVLCLNSESNSTALSPLRLQVFDILNPGSAREELISRLVDTKVFKDKRSGRLRDAKGVWESLDVSPAVTRWRAQPHRNHGLWVRLSTPDSPANLGTHLKRVRLKRSVSDTSSERSGSVEQWRVEQPVLVAYSVDKKHKTHKQNRKKSGTNQRTRRSSRRKSRKRCKRRRLYVDFNEVGWNDWIVAPPGYEAYYCAGECPSHLASHMNATNHAIVQNLVHSVNSKAVPKPCCVPTDLSSITMLYREANDKVTIKMYQDMVVEGCGCR